MIDLEEKMDGQIRLEKKRKDILDKYRKGKTLVQIAIEHGMSKRGIAELLKMCISYGYISESEYKRIAHSHMVASFKRAKK